VWVSRLAELVGSSAQFDHGGDDFDHVMSCLLCGIGGRLIIHEPAIHGLGPRFDYLKQSIGGSRIRHNQRGYSTWGGWVAVRSRVTRVASRRPSCRAFRPCFAAWWEAPSARSAVDRATMRAVSLSVAFSPQTWSSRARRPRVRPAIAIRVRRPSTRVGRDDRFGCMRQRWQS
jgi:hypothetical protein